MRSISKLKLITVFSLLLILVIGFVRLGTSKLTTYAANPPFKSSVSSVVNCGAWNVIASPNVLTGNTMFYGIAAVNTRSVWAVGYYTYRYGNQDYDRSLVERWDGTKWSVIATPNPGLGGDVFNGVLAINAKNVWVVGASWDISGNTVQALIEHWNGKNWSVISSPIVREQLTGITRVPGTNQLWAVGLGGLIEHWDGISWSIVSNPNAGTLKGVAANNANDVWAVGQTSGSSYQTLVEHWDGTSWSVISSPIIATDTNALYGVARISGSSKMWAVGSDAPPISPSQTLTERWNGTKWSVIHSQDGGSNSYSLSGVVAVSTANVWAVGGVVNDPNTNILQALIKHWNGKNWNIVSSPNNPSNGSFLEAITRVPGTNQLWAAGTVINYNSYTNQTLIEFYC